LQQIDLGCHQQCSGGSWRLAAVEACVTLFFRFDLTIVSRLRGRGEIATEKMFVRVLVNTGDTNVPLIAYGPDSRPLLVDSCAAIATSSSARHRRRRRRRRAPFRRLVGRNGTQEESLPWRFAKLA